MDKETQERFKLIESLLATMARNSIEPQAV